MTNRFIIAAALLSSSIWLFASCSRYSSSTDIKLNTGYTLSDVEISILQNETETLNEPLFKITDSTVYYWTDSGENLHLFMDCQSFSKTDSSKIKEGDISKAYSNNKTKPCSFCLKKANIKKEDFPPFTSNETTSASQTESNSHSDKNIVYVWTKSGSKLHLSEDCRYLSGTLEENKIRGSKEKASEYGISEICSNCQKNLN